MRQRVYISGPITNGGTCTPAEEEFHLDNALDIASTLSNHGFAPFVPHLTIFWDRWYKDMGVESLDHATWLDMDYPWVAVSDAVYRMEGASTGADLEVEFARAHGIPVYYSVKELVAGLEGDGPCNRALRAVYGQRGADYGHPLDDFSKTAAFWSVLFGTKVEPAQVGLAMILLKLSREMNRHKDDNLTDINGYSETVDLVLKELERRQHARTDS